MVLLRIRLQEPGCVAPGRVTGGDANDNLNLLLNNFIQLYRDTSPLIRLEYPDYAYKDNQGEERGLEYLCGQIEAWYTLEGYPDSVIADTNLLFQHGVKLFDSYVIALVVTEIFRK